MRYSSDTFTLLTCFVCGSRGESGGSALGLCLRQRRSLHPIRRPHLSHQKKLAIEKYRIEGEEGESEGHRADLGQSVEARDREKTEGRATRKAL